MAALLADWTGPYGGQLPFNKVKVAAFEPALTAAMTQYLTEIEAIASNPAPPTFDNTIAAQERSGKPFARATALYGVWTSSLNTAEMKDVQNKMEPKLAEFADKITQNAKLFSRIDAVYQAREHSGLTPEQQRLTWVYWNNAVKEGAKLSPDAKARVTAINQKLAGLYAQFSQNLQHDEDANVLYLKEADLVGLPPSVKGSAAKAAADRGHDGGEFAILNTRSSMDPFLTYSARRDLREKVWRVYYSRGDNRDAYDNTITIIPQILKLRAEKAKLLDYPTYAHWKLQDQMLKTPDAAMALMMRIWPSATQRVHQEVVDMQALADQEGAGITIAPWDYRYYAEKVRKAKFDLEMDQVKPYLQLDKLREGMFWAAGRLYGFTFAKVDGVPAFDPNMVVYEVKDANGRHAALWYFDPYTRRDKNSGAWMNEYRSQQTLDTPVSAIVSNNANFVQPTPGQPVLISWDDAVTMFHEFGHALHSMNSSVTYPGLAGTKVALDFVEFPSQLNENWLPRGEILDRFAVNPEGQPIPPELVRKLLNAQTFNKGFDVTEFLSAAIIDMKLHLAGDTLIDPDAFEKAELSKLGMPSELVMRHRTAQFHHIFGDGYDAGYYGYLWDEVLDHDAFEAFLEAGGPYDPAVAKRLHDDITSVGNSIDPALAFRNFRGRDPEVAAYLRAKGFPIEGSPSKPAGATT